MKKLTPEKTCPNCNCTDRHTRNGHMVLKSLPVKIQKIPKYKCNNCKKSFYDKSIKELIDHKYNTVMKRIALHLYIEGYSIQNILTQMKSEEFKVTKKDVTDYLNQFQSLIADIKPEKKRIKQTDDISRFNKRDAYTFSLLIQEREKDIISCLINGTVSYILYDRSTIKNSKG